MKKVITPIKLIISVLAGIVVGVVVVQKAMGKTIADIKKKSDKYFTLFLLMNQWVKIKQESKNLAVYFERNRYKRIAVYGMSYIGERLVAELRGTGIQAAYGIDRKVNSVYMSMDIRSIDDDLENVDIVVVTEITFYDEIEAQISKKIDCPVVSLEDILYEI